MTSVLNKLTVLTITSNNDELEETIESVEPLTELGVIHIVQNGGTKIDLNYPNILVYNENDTGIYDAINKALGKVTTEYFMLIHAGDKFIATAADLEAIITTLESTGFNLSLNSQYIGRRLHSSRIWRPWMLNLGVQPPHLPCVYRSSEFKRIKYSTRIRIIGDFDFFYKKVNWNSCVHSNKILVHMSPGGLTSNGLKSFIIVSRIFISEYKSKGVLMVLAKIPLKILQAIL
jgi:hypothetical protein